MTDRDTYERFLQDELILRDELAIDRTLLANERTLLAYGRTGMASVVAGITFLHFPDLGIMQYMGMAMIPIGIVILIAGYWRYDRMRATIRRIRRGLTDRARRAGVGGTDGA